MNAKDAKYSVCRHVKTNGRRCQSPALAGGALCYFHRNLHRSHRQPPSAESLLSTWQEETLQNFRLGGDDPLTVARAYPKQNELNFPPLEDAESVQLATSMLFQAISTGQIHFARARLLLASLKIASINLRDPRRRPLRQRLQRPPQPHRPHRPRPGPRRPRRPNPSTNAASHLRANPGRS